VAGYDFVGVDNDRYMLGDRKDYPRCRLCGTKTDPLWIDPDFRLGRRKLDISFTYDGYLIVSLAITKLLSESEIRFLPLPSEPGFFVVDAMRVSRSILSRQTRSSSSGAPSASDSSPSRAHRCFRARTCPND